MGRALQKGRRKHDFRGGVYSKDLPGRGKDKKAVVAIANARAKERPPTEPIQKKKGAVGGKKSSRAKKHRKKVTRGKRGSCLQACWIRTDDIIEIQASGEEKRDLIYS